MEYRRLILLGYMMGAVYLSIECLWRGWTNVSMLFVGGLCGICVGLLNEKPIYYNLKIYQQAILGAIIVTFIEFISGMILNVWLKLNVWSYANVWGNLYGQICIQYTFFWVLLTPLGIWLDDYLRYKFFGEEYPDALSTIYKKLFTLK